MTRTDPAPEPSAFRDRSARLVLLGVLAVGLGGAGILLGVLHLLLPVLRELLPDPEALVSDARSAWTGFLLYGLLGAVLIWSGIGSLRKRRWVAPVMRILGWIWLIAGLLGLLLVAGMLDGLLLLASPDRSAWPPGFALLVKAVVLGAGVLGGVLLPMLIVWGYRHADVERTCRRHDPAPAWTDRCPEPVLGLAIALGLAALLAVPLAIRPVVPVFGVLITGWPGAVLTLILGVAAGLLARSVYRLSKTAWWVTSVSLVVLGAALAITFQLVEPAEFYGALGYPRQQLDALATTAHWWRLFGVWGTVGLTLVSVGYMLTIRRRFGAPRQT